MSEMAQTATRLVVLGRGRLISESSVEDFTGHAAASGVLVRTPETAHLRQVLGRRHPDHRGRRRLSLIHI